MIFGAKSLNINATAIYGKYFCTEGYLVKNFTSPAEILCVNVYVWKMVIIFRSWTQRDHWTLLWYSSVSRSKFIPNLSVRFLFGQNFIYCWSGSTWPLKSYLRKLLSEKESNWLFLRTSFRPDNRTFFGNAIVISDRSDVEHLASKLCILPNDGEDSCERGKFR